MLSLGVGVWASWAALMWLLVDASRSDFDPRPALRRVVESGREAALTAAALLSLLVPTPGDAR